jgi:homoserine O-acetyltransferase
MIRHELWLDDFAFEAGGRLGRVKVVYHTSPVRRGRVVWICHALTANSDPEDWWPEMVGPGKFFDTERDFIVCVNMLASPYGSSGPASADPVMGQPYFFDFPAVTVRDMVAAMAAVRRELAIDRVDLLVGSSIGGFQAVEWAVTEPDLFEKAAFIATSPRVSPYLSAGIETQRMALEADPSFRQAASLAGGAAGLRCARAQALISYRSFIGYGLTQAEPDDDTLFATRAASYERYQGEKLIRRGFDAYSYYYLCNAVDSHNVGRGRGGVAAALGRIRAKTVVASIDSDCIFPPAEIEQWARNIPGAVYKRLYSSFGHDGFLLETQQLIAILEPLLCKSSNLAARRLPGLKKSSISSVRRSKETEPSLSVLPSAVVPTP